MPAHVLKAGPVSPQKITPRWLDELAGWGKHGGHSPSHLWWGGLLPPAPTSHEVGAGEPIGLYPLYSNVLCSRRSFCFCFFYWTRIVFDLNHANQHRSGGKKSWFLGNITVVRHQPPLYHGGNAGFLQKHGLDAFTHVNRAIYCEPQRIALQNLCIHNAVIRKYVRNVMNSFSTLGVAKSQL